MKKEIASLFIRIGDDDNKRDWEALKRKKKQEDAEEEEGNYSLVSSY